METITHLRALFCVQVRLDPLPDNKILDWSKLKQIADDIFMRFKIDNKCHIGLENNCEKGEIACFPLLYIFSAAKCGIVW